MFVAFTSQGQGFSLRSDWAPVHGSQEVTLGGKFRLGSLNLSHFMLPTSQETRGQNVTGCNRFV